MTGNGKKDRMELPLAGAVLCCTSVQPEQRTQLADYAVKMGAEHKLDLTSDVTHLLVGDINTPKYRYVAREREDVKVLMPDWVEAVRKCWMNDEKIDLNALEAEYRLPTFAGLNICITGFDDLSFRAQMQNTINQNGGSYTGDLNKAVTHLIALKPEGKKYQYASQWQIKIVTLEWLRDSVERKMALDESLYHPMLQPEERGIGAWNKQTKPQGQLGKRTRPQEAAPEPSRKLRRTASAKLSSQNDSMWGDIVGGGDLEKPEHESLRPSKSMPAIRQTVQQSESFTGVNSAITVNTKPQGRNPATASLKHGFLDSKYFCLQGFDKQKTELLNNVLLDLGATVLQSMEELQDLHQLPPSSCFLVVPHSSPASSFNIEPEVEIVTELWVESCMMKKQYVRPEHYPLGGLIATDKEKSLRGLTINSSGFPSVELRHISKVVRVLGAQYEETLKPGISVLICHNANFNIDKIRHAREWRIPVVSFPWLLACITTGSPVPFDAHILKMSQSSDQTRHSDQVQTRDPTYAKSAAPKDGENRGRHDEEKVIKAPPVDVPTQLDKKEIIPSKPKTAPRPGSDFCNHAGVESNRRGRDPEGDETVDSTLQEISANSPSKARSSSPKKRKSLFKTYDGHSSVPEANEAAVAPVVEAIPSVESNSTDPTAQHAHLLNGAIQDLLNQNARTKSAASSLAEVPPPKKLMGRALSNLSNSSMDSRVKASRASSVDSANTDGVGSEILPESLENGRLDSTSLRGRGIFIGRAKPKEEPQKASSIELNDAGLYRDEHYEEANAPQMTQLGYADPEEAILLRKKLAEKRRKKSRIGQEQGRPHEVDTPVNEGIERNERRIRDDDAMLDGGASKWGGGRRTRHKERSPRRLKDF